MHMGDREANHDEVMINLVQNSNGETNKERHELVRHLQKEAFQLANYYFIFQGVIFTAFYSGSSKLKCRYHWIPFTLSFLAGFLNLCALSTIAMKYKSTLDEIDEHKRMIINASNPGSPEPIGFKCPRIWRTVYVIGCIVLFLGFISITLLGSWIITCDENPVSAVAPPTGAP